MTALHFTTHAKIALFPVDQDRTAFEQRQRAAFRFVIDHGGNLVVRRDLQELGLELLAIADIDRHGFIGHAQFFQQDEGLAAIRGGPGMQCDHQRLQ